MLPPSGQIGAKQQQPQQQQQLSLCVYMPVATAEKYSRLIQICASIWTATLAVINVRHAAGHSPDAITCSDTRAGADQNRSPAMFAIAGLRGNGIWISTKEPCSAEDHRNRDRHRNDAGSSLVLTKTPCSRHRYNTPLMTNCRARYEISCTRTGAAYALTWSTAQSRHDITGG